MKNLELNNYDSEDIEDLLVKIEKSFDIQFENNELAHVENFGELCDYISNKISAQNRNDCTLQQAFYKLKFALLKDESIPESITPKTSLSEIFPSRNRIQKVKQLEDNLGFKISILRAAYWITGIFTITLICSIVFIFFNFYSGLFGIILSIVALKITNENANIFNVETLREVAEKMTRENYKKSRRNSGTFNKNEIEHILTDWFKSDFGLENLNRESNIR